MNTIDTNKEDLNDGDSRGRRPTRIYINGFMGSGKSTVGPLLASKLQWHFVDLDETIVSSIQMPIAAYFKEAGEPAFRAIEKEELIKTRKLNKHVIALGGGALCNQQNLEWTLTNGLVVYLELSIEALTARLKNEYNTRPMLLGKDGRLLNDNIIQERITSLMDKRQPYYESAHLIIKTDGLSAGDIARKIANHHKLKTQNPKL